MDEDEHRRAEEEMKELHLRHLHQRNESQKFVNRLVSTFYKALVLAIALGFLCFLPLQFATFGRYFRRAVLARTWDAVNIVLVGFAIAYGVLGRGRIADPDVQENDRNRYRNDFYVNRFLESGEEYTESVDERKESAPDSSVEVVDDNVVSPFVRDDGKRKKNAEVVSSNPKEMPLEPLLEINRFAESLSGHGTRSLRNSISYQDLREFSRGEQDSFRRRTMDDMDLDRRNRHRSQHLAPESNGFEDSAPKSTGVKDSALESNGYEDSPQIKSDGLDTISDSGYQSSRKSEVINNADSYCSSVITAEAVEASEDKHILSKVDVRRGPPPPPPPPPPPHPPTVSIISPPQNDSNMQPPAMHCPPVKRKRKIISPPPPPPPPPRPPPALETPVPKQRTKDESGHEKSENPKKLEKIKSDKKNLSNLPPRPPSRPTEYGVTVNNESRHRKSRSEEDYKQRTSKEDEHRHRSSKEDEHKHRSSKDENKYKSAKDIFGLLDRKHRKIPSPPTPPPPSTLQQWWSSYKKDSKHKNKDSEPSPRPRSDKSSRKVHSSSSPPPAPPPPPPPPPTSIMDRISISKHHRKGRSSTSLPPDPPPPPPPPPPPTSVVDRFSKHHKNGSSESNGLSKLRRDETSEIRNSLNSSKENIVGDSKAEEKSARRESLPIPLPPPPPPPFPDHQWALSDTKDEKKRISPAASVESESEPEPERGWAFVFRKQFSLDNCDPPFCPSPSPDEVNRQADAFIANFHQQIRLQKLNSFNERLKGGRN